MKQPLAVRLRRIALTVLINILITIALLELALRLFDPWGSYSYLRGLIQLHSSWVADGETYTLPPGEHQFGGWSVTMTESGFRDVPDTAAGSCVIHMVGDSVTFGHGVNDDETWVNKLAEQVDARLVNDGMTLYSISDVEATINQHDADGYVYIIVENDQEPGLDWQASRAYNERRRRLFAVTAYAYVMRTGEVFQRVNVDMFVSQQTATPRFEAALARLLTRDDVLLFVLDTNPAFTEMVRAFDDRIITLPAWAPENRVSRTDVHANPQASVDVARFIRPYLTEFIAAQCPP